MALTPGTRLGPYEVIAPLGAGGMGEVYRARDTKLQRDVAIKVLPDDLAADAERLARFEREARVLAALNHPNIAAIHGVEDSAGTPALVMELVEGPTLADRIAPGPLPLAEALPIARQIAQALQAAHEQGIIHRDLKPANIKVRDDGTVKVLDFGLAKAIEKAGEPGRPGEPGQARGSYSPDAPDRPSPPGLSASPTLTSPVGMTGVGVILGTAAYMAPEQARGKRVDKRADIWAFGCVLYEMLTGRRAFDGDDVVEVLAATIHKQPDWSALSASVPAPVMALLKRCLAKDPQARLRDMAAAIFVLDESDSLTAQSSAPSDASRPVESARTRTAFWTRLAMVAVAALAVAAGAGSVAWRMKPAPPRPVVRFAIPLPADQVFTNTGNKLVAVSPDGSRLVYVANRRLFMRTLSTPDATAIAGSSEPNGLGVPAFSPDGQSLLYWSIGDRTLKRIAANGGASVTVASLGLVPLGIFWDVSGILVGQGPGGIVRIPSGGGAPEVLATVERDEIAAIPELLPGEVLVFSVKKAAEGWDQGHIVAQKLQTGERRTVVEGGAHVQYLPSGHLLFARSGGLYATRFDARTLSAVGAPVLMVEGVRRSGGTGLGASGTANGVTHATVSPAGDLVYLPGPNDTTNDGNGLAIFDRNGGAAPLDLPASAVYFSPRVSPDGRFVAYEYSPGNETAIWIADISGRTAPRRLTFDRTSRAPIWSPDGVWLAFQSGPENDRAVYRQRADGSGQPERLTQPDGATIYTPQSWSPDGKVMLVSAERQERLLAGAAVAPAGAPKPGLAVLSLDTRQVSPFGDVTAREASFSPDGRWVAYQEFLNGQAGQYSTTLEPFPRTGAKYRVPVDVAGHPFWGPKGDEIVMNTGQFSSTLVRLTALSPLTFGRPTAFPRIGRTEPNPTTGRRNADMMPDGRVMGVRSLVIGTQASQINVVLNWIEELQAKLP